MNKKNLENIITKLETDNKLTELLCMCRKKGPQTSTVSEYALSLLPPMRRKKERRKS